VIVSPAIIIVRRVQMQAHRQ